jgi:transposase
LARGDLSDAQWERLEKELPGNGRRGRPWKDHRVVVNGILWALRTGAPWRDLPERYGPYTTCHDRLIRWKRNGTWDRVLQALQGEADAEGEIAWGDCALDGSSVKAHPHAAGARKSPPKRSPPMKNSPKKGAIQQAVRRRRRQRMRRWVGAEGD